jgi:hypothetical protein
MKEILKLFPVIRLANVRSVFSVSVLVALSLTTESDTSLHGVRISQDLLHRSAVRDSTVRVSCDVRSL